MAFRTLAFITLLAGPVIAIPKPLAHGPFSGLHLSANSTDVFPTCTATGTAGHHWSPTSRASGYQASGTASGMVISTLAHWHPLPKASGILLTTGRPAPSPTIILEPTVTQQTVERTRTTTLTYTLGTGTATSLRTVVVTHTTMDTLTSTTTLISTLPGSQTSGSATVIMPYLISFPPDGHTTVAFDTMSIGQGISDSPDLATSPPVVTVMSTTTETVFSTTTVFATRSDSQNGPLKSHTRLTSSASTGSATKIGAASEYNQLYVAVSVAERFGMNVNDFMASDQASNPPSCSDFVAGDVYCAVDGRGASSGEGLSSLKSISPFSYQTDTNAPTTLGSSLNNRPSTVSQLGAHKVHTEESPTGSDWPSRPQNVDTSVGVGRNPSYTRTTATSPHEYTSASISTLSGAGAWPSPTSAASAVDRYQMYIGDGSHADGWPPQSEWVEFGHMFAANKANMKASCAQWGVPDDSDVEIADMKKSILYVANSTGVDERFILAVVMQESTGCVRVVNNGPGNPGLMQSHNGTGSCNDNTAAIGTPGLAGNGEVQTPCPYSEIHQQIHDGAAGTIYGAGLKQCLRQQQQQQHHTDVSQFYRAARMYNSGSIDSSGDLGKGGATKCYASDIANRLTGWVNAPHDCTL